MREFYEDMLDDVCMLLDFDDTKILEAMKNHISIKIIMIILGILFTPYYLLCLIHEVVLPLGVLIDMMITIPFAFWLIHLIDNFILK